MNVPTLEADDWSPVSVPARPEISVRVLPGHYTLPSPHPPLTPPPHPLRCAAQGAQERGII